MLAVVLALGLVRPGVAQEAGAGPYSLAPGDSIRLLVPGLPGADQVALIGPDGHVRVAYAGRIAAAALVETRARLETRPSQNDFLHPGDSLHVLHAPLEIPQ